MPSSPLLVLDTNVVLDWVAFDDTRVQPIAAAIERKTLPLVSNEDCVQELRRALGYPQVKLDAPMQASALARYLALARMFELPAGAASAQLPQCEDPDDQKFLDLAWHAGASHLLTRDKALLKLARSLAHRFAILRPDEFLERMAAADRPPPG
ncbi:MAG: putative toxin-antitoxin system toxin component, PIN family [Proteobacteria bacterium]|nr:putative toxin-antitoxin system toxin component, PIN family [Pseudomonadota bacterium]